MDLEINPTQPEPNVMLNRVKDIVDVCGGLIRCINGEVLEFVKNEKFEENSIIYIDPPYINTTGYSVELDVVEVVNLIPKYIPTYVSECNVLSDKYEFITKGKSKGNMTGVVKTKRRDDLLNIFNK